MKLVGNSGLNLMEANFLGRLQAKPEDLFIGDYRLSEADGKDRRI